MKIPLLFFLWGLFFVDLAVGGPTNVTKYLRSKTSSRELIAGHDFCWKSSYGRGAGRVLRFCPSSMEKIGALCYPRCPDNMARFGFDCHTKCPHGWSDTGLHCAAPTGTYGRGWGYALWDEGKCKQEHPATGCEQCLAMFYPTCIEGYKHAGCNLCEPKTINCGAYNMGARVFNSCEKKIIIGQPKPLVCHESEEQNGALCYPRCGTGYRGDGPVCWADNPSGWVDCGAGAAKDDLTCAAKISDQVGSVAYTAAVTGLAVATAGASLTVTVPAGAPAGVARFTKHLMAHSDLYIAVSALAFTASWANSVRVLIDQANARGELTPAFYNRMIFAIKSILDPSGVSGMVAAYSYDTCDKITAGQTTGTGGSGGGTGNTVVDTGAILESDVVKTCKAPLGHPATVVLKYLPGGLLRKEDKYLTPTPNQAYTGQAHIDLNTLLPYASEINEWTMIKMSDGSFTFRTSDCRYLYIAASDSGGPRVGSKDIPEDDIMTEMRWEGARFRLVDQNGIDVENVAEGGSFYLQSTVHGFGEVYQAWAGGSGGATRAERAHSHGHNGLWQIETPPEPETVAIKSSHGTYLVPGVNDTLTTAAATDANVQQWRMILNWDRNYIYQAGNGLFLGYEVSREWPYCAEPILLEDSEQSYRRQELSYPNSYGLGPNKLVMLPKQHTGVLKADAAGQVWLDCQGSWGTDFDWEIEVSQSLPHTIPLKSHLGSYLSSNSSDNTVSLSDVEELWTMKELLGGKTTLQNSEGKYLATSNGTIFLTDTHTGPEAMMEKVDHDSFGSSFYLKTSDLDTPYLRASDTGVISLHKDMSGWDRWYSHSTNPVEKILMSTHTTFLVATNNGQSIGLTSNVHATVKWTVKKRLSGECNFQNQEGKYLGVKDDGTLYAADQAGTWENFRLIEADDDILVYIKTHHNTYLKASDTGVVSTSSQMKGWEKWRLTDMTIATEAAEAAAVAAGPPPKLLQKQKEGGYDWSDAYGGYFDLQDGQGCQLCRWDGPSGQFPGVGAYFPDPSTSITYGDKYEWLCSKSGVTAWPMNNDQTRCFQTSTALQAYGYGTPQRGVYEIQDSTLSCGWIGNCWLASHDTPPRNQRWTRNGQCGQPSWWSCRQGEGTGGDTFNTGLGYFDSTPESFWVDLQG